MATDSAALAIALLASRIALRVPSDQRSYGDRRIEVLAAAFNSLLLLLVAGWILMQSVPRGHDLASLRAQILATTGVHDLHLWSVAGDDATLTAHIVLDAGAAPQAVRTALMQSRSPKIGQVTLQFEETDCRLA